MWRFVIRFDNGIKSLPSSSLERFLEMFFVLQCSIVKQSILSVQHNENNGKCVYNIPTIRLGRHSETVFVHKTTFCCEKLLKRWEFWQRKCLTFNFFVTTNEMTDVRNVSFQSSAEKKLTSRSDDSEHVHIFVTLFHPARVKWHSGDSIIAHIVNITSFLSSYTVKSFANLIFFNPKKWENFDRN